MNEKLKPGRSGYRDMRESVDELKKIFSGVINRNGKQLATSTINNYANKLCRLQLEVTGEPFSGSFEWLNDPDAVLAALEKCNLMSKKDYLTPACKILKVMDADLKLLARYQHVMSNYKNEETQRRQENMATPLELTKVLPYDEIQKRINEFDPSTYPLDTREKAYMNKLICVFYFQSTLVPRNNLPDMKYIREGKKNKMQPEYNYIVCDSATKPIRIVMNRYKTEKVYGTQTFEVTPQLQQALVDYMKITKRGPGDFIFMMDNGMPYRSTNFVNVIATATKEVLDKAMNVDLIRSIIITHYYDSGLHSIAEDREFARRFLHSTTVQKEYMKLNISGDSHFDDE